MKIPPKKYLVAVLVVILVLVRLTGRIGQEGSPQDRFRVVRVIDGDTIELAGGDRLRLTAIDCPERNDPYYDEATTFLEQILTGRRVSVVFGPRRRDHYGRLLGHIYLDSLWVNRAILERGLGHIYLFDDNLADSVRLAGLLAAQETAMNAGINIWSLAVTEEPFYLARKGSFRFHRPFCRSVADRPADQLIRFESRREAFRRGYSPCRNCRP